MTLIDCEINVPTVSALTPAGRADMHRDTCPSASSYHAQRISGRILLLSGGPSPLEGRGAEPKGSRPRHVSPLGAICHLNNHSGGSGDDANTKEVKDLCRATV